MDNRQEGGQGLDLRVVLATLRRRMGLIALCFLVVTGGALGFSLAQQKQYSATASLLFRDPGFGQTLFGAADVQPTSDPTREAATNVDLASLRVVSERTAETHRQRPERLRRRVPDERECPGQLECRLGYCDRP